MGSRQGGADSSKCRSRLGLGQEDVIDGRLPQESAKTGRIDLKISGLSMGASISTDESVSSYINVRDSSLSLTGKAFWNNQTPIDEFVDILEYVCGASFRSSSFTAIVWDRSGMGACPTWKDAASRSHAPPLLHQFRSPSLCARSGCRVFFHLLHG